MRNSPKPSNLQAVAELLQDGASPPINGKQCIADAEQLAADEMALHPDMPSAQLAVIAVQECGPDFRVDLSRYLLLKFFARVIRAKRAKALRAERLQLQLPGFEHLPATIRISDTSTVPLEDATYTDVRSYYRRLHNRQQEKLMANPKRVEAKRLMDLMAEYSNIKGITVKEVFARERDR